MFNLQLEKDTTDANLMDYASKLDTLANLPANSPGTVCNLVCLAYFEY